MKNVIAKLLLALSLFAGVSLAAAAVTRASPVGQPARITENEQEIQDLRWEMLHEENERGHESFEPGIPSDPTGPSDTPPAR